MADLIRPLPILSHMPRHVTQKIVEHLNASRQMRLRQCSKQLQKVVDVSATQYGDIYVTFSKTKVEILFDGKDLRIILGAHPEGYRIRTTGPLGEERIVKGKGNYIERTVRFFKSLFKNSKKSVKRLEFRFTQRLAYDRRRYETIKSEFIEKMRELLARTQHLFSIKTLGLYIKLNDQDVLTYLQFCQPGYLGHIHILPNIDRHPFPILSIPEVTGYEQWRQAKKFTGYGFVFTLPYHEWAHLEISLLSVPTLSLQDLKSLIQSYQLNANWSYFSLRLTEGNSEIISYFASLPISKPESKYRCSTKPGSNSLEIRTVRKEISLPKVEAEEDETDSSDDDSSVSDSSDSDSSDSDSSDSNSSDSDSSDSVVSSNSDE